MPNAIEVNHLVKKYKQVTAVNDISFTVNQGEVFAFLGPNGAGKSTTIKMVTTLLKPTSGTITLNGYDPIKEQDKARASFGIVFQDMTLDDELTVYENMDFHGIIYKVPSKLRKERIQRLLTMVELWDRRNQQVKTFSGGMKRRLEIARGLLHEPEIFFLDEPTVGLDPQTRNQLWDYLRMLNNSRGMTIFLTTHYMEEADKIADRIAIIDHGSIVAMGTSAELKQQTQTKTLEEAFLKLTGNALRDQTASDADRLRQHRTMGRR